MKRKTAVAEKPFVIMTERAKSHRGRHTGVTDVTAEARPDAITRGTGPGRGDGAGRGDGPGMITRGTGAGRGDGGPGEGAGPGG
jgi:hypothetical protein